MKAPTPPPGRLVGTSGPLAKVIAATTVLTAIALPLALAAAVFFPRENVQTAIGSPCAAPTEHERLLVVVGWNDGRLAAECVYVGSRGSYSRRSVRHLVAK